MPLASRVAVPEPTLRLDAPAPGVPARARRLALAAVALGTLLVLWVTRPETTADAPDYARDIVWAETRGWRVLVEPGHLAWRPLGHLVTKALGLPAGAGDLEQMRVTQQRMTVIASAAGVAGAVAVALLTWHLVPVAWAGVAAGLLFALSSSFISYAQAGTSYIPGLACLAFGLVLGWDPRARPSLRRGLAGGALVALGVLFWLPYVLVVPAALLGWLVWRPEGRTRAGLAEFGAALGACAALGLGSYLGAAAAAGVRDLGGFLTWLGGTSHGVTTGGISRAVLGFPRSFLYMGHDGREVKRFLLHDPVNVVTRADLLRLGLWPKMAAFYVGGLVTLLLAWGAARRWLALLAVAAVPTLALAVFWMGGDLERYLALYPFLLPLVAFALVQAGRAKRPALAVASLAPLVFFWVGNLVGLGPVAARRADAAVLARLGCLRDSLTAKDILVVPAHGDPMLLYTRNELDRLPRRAGAEVITFVRPGAPETDGWRDSTRARVARQQAEGGRVWVAEYVRAEVPPPEMGWVEGLDRRATWADMRAAWREYDLRPACGAEPSGFLRVAPAP